MVNKINKIYRCKGHCKNGKRCRKRTKEKLCPIHEFEISSKEFIAGSCFLCNNECNTHSQVCGRCARGMTGFKL